jgi:hypothetical protein
VPRKVGTKSSIQPHKPALNETFNLSRAQVQ